MSNILFTILLLLILIISIIADKKNNKFLLATIILSLTIIGGLRGNTVGIDTAAYYYSFNNNFPIAWQFEENGFRVISMFLMKVFNNATYLMVIYSFVTNLLIITRLWELRKKANFPFMIFLYLSICFINTMNIMRQYICIAIIFYSTRFLEKKKYLLFLIIVLLSSTIHKTALLALLLLLVYIWDSLSKKQKVILAIPISIISIFALIWVFKVESNHIMNYFSADNAINNINITFLYRIFIFIFAFLLMKFNIKITFKKKKYKNIENYELITKNEFNRVSIIYFLGLLCSSAGMFFSFLTRIGLYYSIFEIVFWGYLIKKNKNSELYFMLISIYSIYVFAIELLLNGSGIFPYYFNF